jgi:hypothetical protein
MILSPAKEPNKWLCAILVDLLEQNTEASRSDLRQAITEMAMWMEPGLIDQLFADWIDQYQSLKSEP